MNKLNSLDQYERVEYDFLDSSKIEKLIEKLPDLYTEEEFNNIIKDKNINMTKKLFCIKKNDNRKEDLLSSLKSTYELYNRKIDPHTIIKLFYNIRKIEYYLDPENTSFTYEDILVMTKTYLTSLCALNDKPTKNFQEYCGRLMLERTQIAQYIDESLPNIRKDIERTKITRNLREYILKK